MLDLVFNHILLQFYMFLISFLGFLIYFGIMLCNLLVYFVVCMQIGRYNMVLCRLVATDDKAR